MKKRKKMKYEDWEQLGDDMAWFDKNTKGYFIGKRHTKNEFNSKIYMFVKDKRKPR